MVAIKEMEKQDIGRIAEIDRSEHVTLAYAYREGMLEAEEVDWRVPRWFDRGPQHSVEGFVEDLAPVLEELGTMYGAFDGPSLVGVMIYRPHLTETMSQLVFLHVSNGYRRRGIATRLTEKAIRLARADGAERLYVSATPSESAIGFYRRQGFQPTDRPHPDLYELEPEDIHMIMKL